MRLIGMLDSPFVRRVAIALDLLDVAFTHEAVSVFRHFEHFRSLNPVVKAPTLICDDGTVLMDSSLILQFIEATLSNGRSLWIGEQIQLQHEFRAVSLALVACEKSAQAGYETNLRPKDRQYEPWLQRVRGQLQDAFAALDLEIQQRPKLFSGAPNHASLFAAVAWQFGSSLLPELLPAALHPQLAALSERMEQHPSFVKFPPTGPGIQAPPI